MRGIPGRIAANVLWVVAFSVIAVIASFVTYSSGLLFEDTYQVRVPMPEAGGVVADQRVTVLGRAVGVVTAVDLTTDGVVLTLQIEGDKQVPEQTDVKVLRRSPIGEQTVDFRPTTADWTPAERGAVIEPAEAIVPPEIPFLLEQTADLFNAIDTDDVAVVVAEAADALRGRGPTLRTLNRDVLELNRTLVDGIPEFERVIDSSQAVLSELREHRAALASSFTNAADLAEVFDEQSPNISALLDSGTGALEEADALIRNERANLECLLSDVVDLNDMLLGPSTFEGDRELYTSKLDELESGLQRHAFFFDNGVPMIATPDPVTGLTWQRIMFEDPFTPTTAQPYDEPRPTPATRPGAACQSPAFGLGANAVRQDDPVPPHSTSPGIHYAPLASDGEHRRDR